MSNLITTAKFLSEPTSTASVMACWHRFDPTRQYGSGFALCARCAR
jgi:hypothetical protein